MALKNRRIRSFLPFLLTMLSLAAPCFAQQAPAWELYGGYSLARDVVREYYKSTPAIYTFSDERQYLNGWEVSATENVSRWFGGTMDFSAHAKTPNLLGIANHERTYSILYGPRFYYQIHGFLPFVHVLLGADHDDVAVTPVGPSASSLSFAGALGAGVDLKLWGPLAIRLFQIDYLKTTTLGEARNNYRGSAGLVFRLGKRH